MEIKVDLNPEQINKTIADAIAKSAIGEELNRIIKEQVKKLSSSYDNPIEKVVHQEIVDQLRAVVTNEYSDVIKKMVQEKVTEEFTKEFFAKLWDSFISRW